MAAPSRLPRISFDVVGHIIEQVSFFQDGSRILTLKSCALVSRDCLSPSQRGLFRTVTFSSTFEEQLSKYKKFKAMILSHPHFALYIREFSIRDDAFWHGTVDSLIWEPSLPSILDMLQHISKFKWTRHYDEEAYRWNGLSANFRKSLMRIFNSPHITNICLAGIVGLPPSIATRMASISSLEISYVQFALHDSDTIREDTNVIVDDARGIERLTIGMIHAMPAKSLIDAILCGQRKLKYLHIAAPLRSLGSSIPKILQAHKDHLSSIGLPMHIQPDELSTLDIWSMPKLEHLRYGLDVSHSYISALTKTCHNLRLCCKEGNIKALTFEIWYSTQWEEMYTHGRLNWDKLDKLLVEQLFCNLEKVYFVFRKDLSFRPLGGKRIDAVDIDNIRQLLESFLPRTKANGLLDCSGLIGEAPWIW